MILSNRIRCEQVIEGSVKLLPEQLPDKSPCDHAHASEKTWEEYRPSRKVSLIEETLREPGMGMGWNRLGVGCAIT